MRIGVLALQGDFVEHIAVLHRLDVETQEVRRPGELDNLDGLIIPGGESTTIGKLAVTFGLLGPIQAFARAGRPIWGTCAGMVLLAREAVDGVPGQPLLGLMDVTVVRNGFGRQVNSFEADLAVAVLGPPSFRGVFIRAPYVQEWGPSVEILARLEQDRVVAVQQGGLLATAFHPELTDDERFHRYFLQWVQDRSPGSESPGRRYLLPVKKEACPSSAGESPQRKHILSLLRRFRRQTHPRRRQRSADNLRLVSRGRFQGKSQLGLALRRELRSQAISGLPEIARHSPPPQAAGLPGFFPVDLEAVE